MSKLRVLCLHGFTSNGSVHAHQVRNITSALSADSGFRARFPQYDSVYAPGIDTPTLHILGEQDHAVSTERSETLLRVCRDASVLRHAGGHEIPTSEEDQAVIIRFLRDKARIYSP